MQNYASIHALLKPHVSLRLLAPSNVKMTLALIVQYTFSLADGGKQYFADLTIIDEIAECPARRIVGDNFPIYSFSVRITWK